MKTTTLGSCALGILAACSSLDAPAPGAGLADDEITDEITDEMLEREAARLAMVSGGRYQLGRAFAHADLPDGHREVMLDPALLRAKVAYDAAYRERVRARYGDERSPFTPYAVIGTDNRTAVGAPRSYPYSKHVYIVMQRPHTELTERRASAYICSGTFLDEDFVLTAAHCIYNRGEGHFAYANDPVDERPSPFETQWGTDYGRGFACLGDDIDSSSEFASNCEFIQARWAAPDWVNGVGSDVDSDFAVVKLQRANHPSGMGAGRWMAMSSIDSAATYDDKTAVINGFPTTGPDGANFVQQLVSVTDPTIDVVSWQTANWAFYTPATLYHRSGDIDNSTTQEHLAYTADSSGGDSGAAVFYYTDNATDYNGQAHYILGVHHGGTNSDGFNTGATVRQFRDWVTGVMAAN